MINNHLVQLIKQPILRIPNSNFPNLSCCKVLFHLFNVEFYWYFWLYCDINLKLLPAKNSQKVKQQKIRCQNFEIPNWLFDELNEITIFNGLITCFNEFCCNYDSTNFS